MTLKCQFVCISFTNKSFVFFARPEVDQFDVDGAIGQDGVVETLHVTANEAFGKFKNK